MIHDLSPWVWGPALVRVPVRRATQIAYERCKETEIGDYVDRVFQVPEQKLSYLFHCFEVHRVPLFAKRPHCAKIRRIVGERPGNLVLMAGASNLASVSSQTTPLYLDAYVRRVDLWRVVRRLRQTRVGAQGAEH